MNREESYFTDCKQGLTFHSMKPDLKHLKPLVFMHKNFKGWSAFYGPWAVMNVLHVAIFDWPAVFWQRYF